LNIQKTFNSYEYTSQNIHPQVQRENTVYYYNLGILFIHVYFQRVTFIAIILRGCVLFWRRSRVWRCRSAETLFFI